MSGELDKLLTEVDGCEAMTSAKLPSEASMVADSFAGITAPSMLTLGKTDELVSGSGECAVVGE
jgi:hypothetical protein